MKVFSAEMLVEALRIDHRPIVEQFLLLCFVSTLLCKFALNFAGFTAANLEIVAVFTLPIGPLWFAILDYVH